MSDQQDTFLREVQEEVRRDRMAKLLDKYGVLALIVCGVLVGGIAGYKWYEAYQRDLAEKAGNRFAVAQRLLVSEVEKDKADAVKDLETLAATSGSSYQTLARLQLAGEKLDAGEDKAAQALFQQVADDAGADPRLKDYARLQAISIGAETETDYAALKARLAPLMDDQNMWRFSAREVLAIAAVRLDRKDEATELLTGLLADAAAPSALRQRAEILLSLLTAPTAPAAPEGAAATPAPAPVAAPSKDEATKKPESDTKTPPSSSESGQVAPSSTPSASEPAKPAN